MTCYCDIAILTRGMEQEQGRGGSISCSSTPPDSLALPPARFLPVSCMAASPAAPCFYTHTLPVPTTFSRMCLLQYKPVSRHRTSAPQLPMTRNLHFRSACDVRAPRYPQQNGGGKFGLCRTARANAAPIMPSCSPALCRRSSLSLCGQGNSTSAVIKDPIALPTVVAYM